MKVNNAELISHLKGNTFSNAFAFKIAEKEYSITNRLEYLSVVCSGKSVIHVGCCDHVPLIKAKVKKNTWLHKRLTEVASECIGIDIDRDAIEYVKNEIGYTNVFFHDLLSDAVNPALASRTWDYMVVGEILEHVDNPVAFLEAIRKKYTNVSRLIVTVPNAFCRLNLKHVFKNEEFINTDHRFWFSPFTLSKIAIQAGYFPEEFIFVEPVPGNFKFYTRFLLKRYPALRETLIGILLTKQD